MKHPDNCPHCNALLDEGDIYEAYYKMYGDEKKALEHASNHGWTKENPERFSRIVGVYDMATDRTTHYVCPECEKIIECG